MQVPTFLGSKVLHRSPTQHKCRVLTKPHHQMEQLSSTDNNMTCNKTTVKQQTQNMNNPQSMLIITTVNSTISTSKSK